MKSWIFASLMLIGCAAPAPDDPEAEIDDRRGSTAPEAYSLDGKPLMRPTLDPETDSLFTANWLDAAEAYEANPNDVDALIWLGRRTAYLWRYNDAIAIFTNGIRDFPDEPRLYRHRGHRYITIRQFDLAIEDLTMAAQLMVGKPDEVEPDGLPNAANIPVSTLGFNIWYHLGLAHYLKGDWDEAVAAFKTCIKYSNNDDAIVSTYDWLFMSLRRAGRTQEADDLLNDVSPHMNILESIAYHRRLLMYKGLIKPEALMDEESANALEIVTEGYGLAFWFRESGDIERSNALLLRVIDTGYWAGFGYIAAESDLNRRIF